MHKLPNTSSIKTHLSESESLSRTPFRFYVKKHKRQFCFGILALLLTNALDSLPPLLVGKAIDQITEKQDFSVIAQTLVLLVAISIVVSVFRYLWRLHWGHYSHRSAQDLKNKIFSKYLNLGQSFFQKNAIGKLMSLINNDVNSFRMAIGPGVLILLDAFFITSFVIPLMISLSPSLTWKTLILLPVVPFIIARIEKLIHKYYKEQQTQFSNLSTTTQEILSGIRTIKSFAQEEIYEHKFKQESKKYEDISNKVARIDAFFSPTMEVSISIGCVTLLFTAAPSVLSGSLTIGALFSFYQYIHKMVWPMTAIGIGITFWQKGKASVERIIELLSTTNDNPDLGRTKLNHFDSLELKDLDFKYTDDNGFRLKKINLNLKPGEIIGVLGKTGSGKSTVTDLIAGVYPVKKGSLLINDQPIQNFTQESVRDIITYVPQDNFLFSDSIYNNTLLSSSESRRDVHRTLELVQLEQEINTMTDKHETVLGERGVNISGGQKQRLGLARGLIRDSKVLILDDSFSAIDANTEMKILNGLKNKLKNLSVIIVSHRLASLSLADKIVVMDDGTIEAIGKHDDLIESSVTYRQVYHAQTDTEVPV